MTRMVLPAEVVFFDVGGPIYPDEAFYLAVVRALDDLLVATGRGPADRDLVRRLYDEVRAGQSGSIRGRLVEQVLHEPSQREQLGRLTAGYWSFPPGSLYSDVLPCLRALQGRVRIGILANQEAAVVEALRRDGVADFIDVWAVSAMVGFEKPDPELFRWALRKAGRPPEQTVHVGNRLDMDVRPAKSLGMRTVWLLRGEAPDRPTPAQLAEPDAVVRDLAGLPALLLGTGEPPSRQ